MQFLRNCPRKTDRQTQTNKQMTKTTNMHKSNKNQATARVTVFKWLRPCKPRIRIQLHIYICVCIECICPFRTENYKLVILARLCCVVCWFFAFLNAFQRHFILLNVDRCGHVKAMINRHQNTHQPEAKSKQRWHRTFNTVCFCLIRRNLTIEIWACFQTNFN